MRSVKALLLKILDEMRGYFSPNLRTWSRCKIPTSAVLDVDNL